MAVAERKLKLTRAQRTKRADYQRLRRLRIKAQKAEVFGLEAVVDSSEMVFVPDSEIPKGVRWDGYGRIKPWIARYVHDTYGCILSKCLIRYDIMKRGHWIKGPRREVSSGNN